MIGRNSMRGCLLVVVTSLMLTRAAPGRERTENVLTLDHAIELARSHNRELNRPDSKSISSKKLSAKPGRSSIRALIHTFSDRNFSRRWTSQLNLARSNVSGYGSHSSERLRDSHPSSSRCNCIRHRNPASYPIASNRPFHQTAETSHGAQSAVLSGT